MAFHKIRLTKKDKQEMKRLWVEDLKSTLYIGKKYNISACLRCNTEVNSNRESWIKFFQSLLSERYGYSYDENQNIVINDVLKQPNYIHQLNDDTREE